MAKPSNEESKILLSEFPMVTPKTRLKRAKFKDPAAFIGFHHDYLVRFLER